MGMHTAKANVKATRRASCNTGNRDTAPGALTIIEMGGGMPYHVETANERHIRETCERLAAARTAKGSASNVATVATAMRNVATSANGAAKAAKALRMACAAKVCTFSTARYMRSHGKAPRGRGCWLFAKGSEPVFQFTGTLSQAKVAARAWAKAQGYGTASKGTVEFHICP